LYRILSRADPLSLFYQMDLTSTFSTKFNLYIYHIVFPLTTTTSLLFTYFNYIQLNPVRYIKYKGLTKLNLINIYLPSDISIIIVITIISTITKIQIVIVIIIVIVINLTI
jgi:hypothetical protein